MKAQETLVYQRQERFGSKRKNKPQTGVEIVSFYNSDAILMSRFVMDGAGESKAGTLDVEFARRNVSGEIKRYRYFNVPQDIILRINSSTSVGETFNSLITMSKLEFNKLELFPVVKDEKVETVSDRSEVIEGLQNTVRF